MPRLSMKSVYQAISDIGSVLSECKTPKVKKVKIIIDENQVWQHHNNVEVTKHVLISLGIYLSLVSY